MNTTIHLTPAELAIRLKKFKRDGVTPNVQTLANWRVEGKGPKFFREGRTVLYPLTEVEAWEARLLQRSTAG